jgi:hypothetical protein
MAANSKRRRSETAKQRPSTGGSGGPPWVLIGGLIAVVAVAGVSLWPGDSATEQAADAAIDEPAEIERPYIATRASSPKPAADAPIPPLPAVPNNLPRSPEVVNAAYTFAAQNPDILEYVPCFCGCESRGHTGNASCFVESRNPDGSVRQWDTHGVACVVCVDVATAARQLHSSGANVEDIREAIETQYARAPTMTPTPAAPTD